MVQQTKTFDELPAGSNGVAGEVPVWQSSGAKKIGFSAFFPALMGLADAAAWRVTLGIPSVMQFKGAIDASANPNYPAATKGDVYKISVAGKIGGGSGIAVEVNDTITASADNAGGSQASVGASWFVSQANIDGAVIGPANSTDSDMAQYDGTTGKVIKGFNGKIKFPAAQSASSDVNTLDDYEEGTWTPTIAGTTGAGSVVYSSQVGNYTKIGRLVIANFTLSISSLSGLTGDAIINGLPFQADKAGTADIAFTDKITFGSGYTKIGGAIPSGTSRIGLVLTGSGINSVNVDSATQLAGTFVTIRGTAIYPAAT